MSHGRRIAVVGLGYIGLPVAVAFARSGVEVVGFDIDAGRVAELREKRDRTLQVEPAHLADPRLRVTGDAAALRSADFYIITVPAPMDAANAPDLAPLSRASETIGACLAVGDIVVYESTVYPGAIESHCIPLLEKFSELAAGRDFFVAYSPERINPGDKEHRLETIAKVVAGQDARTVATVAEVYRSVVRAGVHIAPSIRVAEVAKLVENAQRDFNIAFMNELSAICHALGIDTADVLAAAATKWNFVPFAPGLVGGQCVPVEPHRLAHAAEAAGLVPGLLLAARRTNDAVVPRIARECARLLRERGVARGNVVVLGLAYKENVPDIRNARSLDLVRALEAAGLKVQAHDPLVRAEDARRHGIAFVRNEELAPADAVILAVPHAEYVQGGWPLIVRLLEGGRGLVMDLKAVLDRASVPSGVELWRL